MKFSILKNQKLNKKRLAKATKTISAMVCAVYMIIYYIYEDFIYTSVTIGREIDCKFSESRADKMSKSPPVILETQFGLGNQLFQYAASYTLARRRNSDLYICLHSGDVPSSNQYKSNRMNVYSNDRSYGLGYLKIPHDKLLIKRDRTVTCESLLPLSNNVFTANDEVVAKCQVPADRIVKMYGYFESEIFFQQYKDELLDMFVPINLDAMEKETEDILRQIEEKESICVHVRRGDFDQQEGRRLPITYYIEAMALMDTELATKKLNRTFFVFSDDILKVTQDFEDIINVDRKRDVVFVSNGNFSRFNDLFLMTKCKHLIIANSTFSWWAAYLNKHEDKIVIAPLPKFKDSYTYYNHPYYQLVKKLEFYWSYPTSYRVIKPKFV